MKERLKFSAAIILLFWALNAQNQTFNYPDNSVLATGKWYSVNVSSDGVYKLSYNDFISLGVPAEEIDFDNLSIFGNGGQAIDDIHSRYKGSDLKENAIYVNKQERYALFYAKATVKDTFDAASKQFDFTFHPYADKTRYFITFDKNIGSKKRISEASEATGEVSSEKNTAKDFAYHKLELFNYFSSGRDWLGEKVMSTSTDLNIPVSLPNVSADYPAEFKVKMVVERIENSSCDISLNNQAVSRLYFPPLSAVRNTRTNSLVFSRNLNTAANTVNIHFNAGSSNSQGWLDNILVNYTKQLSFNNNYLKFYSVDTAYNSCIRYSVSGVQTDNYAVWDVTDASNVQSVAKVEKNGSNISFKVPADTIRTLVVLAGNSFAAPVLEDTINNQNLHAIDTADFVIVTYEGFRNQAERLAQLHRDYDSIKVAVVDLQQVFNEFSSGTRDFLAIREFIAMMYQKSGGTKPENLLLFGDGTFDNKNILQYNNNYMPTYQSHNNVDTDSPGITSDDMLAAIGYGAMNSAGDTLFVGIGRITAGDTATAEIIVDKCERYLTKADLKNNENGDWRNAVMLTSDDADNVSELYFIHNAENIYDQITESNPTLNVQKAYEDAYKEYTSSSGATYPDASKAINDRMNKGCLLFNYLGHGSPDNLSSERLITITDIISWSNYNKLCLMITSTCSFNKFDLADRQAAGEYILSSDKGAGIALISAARNISSNDPINRALFKYALERQADGRALTFGQVMKHAKNLVNTGYYKFQLSDAERSITLIGDPALRLSLPEYNVRTLKINGTSYNKQADAFDRQDTVRALSTVTVQGEITDFKGNKIENFNGKIQISLYDKKTKYYTLNNSNIDPSRGILEFELQNNILHKGYAEVVNGEFTHTFTVPKDIAYNYGNGKLSYYAQSDSSDATGYCTEFILGGIDTADYGNDLSRPQISLYLNDTNFVSGGISNENPSLYAIIYDTVPINTVGSGLGHDIVARLDNAANTFILNEYYTVNDTDANTGYITYPFKNLSSGQHTLTLKVWNIYNYSSEKTITFTVASSDKDEYQAISYPNPFKESVAIELRYNQPQSISSAELKIMNQQGALVFQQDISDKIGTYTIGPFIWNRQTNGGAKVQAGIYFYSIIMHTNEGDKIVKGNKMVMLNK